MSSKSSMNQHHPLPSTDEPLQSVEELQQENFALRTQVETLARENALLNEVISTVGSTLRLDEVLRHFIDTVLQATSCNSAFMYLYDKEKERLVLASTAARYQHLVGKISLALGEGIVGWVALHRTPVFLRDQALEDPRFYYFPELEEEKFQSAMTVPILGKDRHLIGVIMLQAVAPHEFSEQDHKFLINTAALVAGAIENAQLYESTQRKLSILTSLSILSQTISSGLYLDDMLRSLATLTLQIMEVDLCVIMLMEQGGAMRGSEAEFVQPSRRLVVRATAPNLNEHIQFHSIDVDHQTLDYLREMNEVMLNKGNRAHSGHHAEMSKYALDQLNPLRDAQYRALISAPLVAGAEQLGLINCYSSKLRRFSTEDQTLLSTIANQAAIAIKNSHLVNQLAQRDLVKGFFEDLMRGASDIGDSLKQRAHFLGFDLTRAHAAVMIEITRIDDQYDDIVPPKPALRQHHQHSPLIDAGENGSAPSRGQTLQTAYKGLYTTLRRRIQDSFSGSIFYEREAILICLLALGKEANSNRLKQWFQELVRQVHHEYGVYLSIGIGNACQRIDDYRRGFAEAKEALQMGQNLHATRAGESKHPLLVTHFNDLGVYRYLYKIAHMDDLRDVYQDQIACIDSYDRRKGTDLLPTLEMYLECAGNLTKTSERLYVHRNTLIQRLERLQSLCEIDLQERSNWLTLQIAIKVYRLRTKGL